MKPRFDGSDDHFKLFAKNLEVAIAKYEKIPRSELTKMQRAQVEKLVGLEKEFRRTLINHPWGPAIYREFVSFICDERRNILAARPYFRERQGVFTAKISKALKKRQDRGLYRFHTNYEFVMFVMAARAWKKNRIGGRVVALADQIRDLRWELVEMNMPLAVARARIFWARTPKAQLSYMDLIQITAMGLMAGVDKFCLPYSAAFRHTLIGRMIGNLIEEYSETLVHFPPSDKRKIYRANKVLSRLTGDNCDFEKVADAVNKDVEPRHRTDAKEIQNLLAAASSVSCDAPLMNEEGESGDVLPLDTYATSQEAAPDAKYEEKEAMLVMGRAIGQLELVEQKLLKMRGIAL